MMKKVFSGLLAVLSASTALAGNFYNADGLDELRSGEYLNRNYDMGLADNAYATLVSSRLVVRAVHAGLTAPIDNLYGTGDKVKVFDAGAGDVLWFYGQEYRVTHWIERQGGLDSKKDICIGVLDRAVEGHQICPIAVHDGEVDDVYIHSLARHKDLITRAGPAFDASEYENNGHLLYGRAYVRKMYDPHHPGAGAISVSIPDYNGAVPMEERAKDLFVPIGGDSSSPAYVELDDNRYALLGLLSTVDGVGKSATYTDLGYNLGWMTDWQERLIAAKVLDEGVDRIQTVSSDHWVKNPDSYYVDLDDGTVNVVSRLPHEFNPAIYLSIYEDLRNAFSRVGDRNATLDEALNSARKHYINSGPGEGRVVKELARVGQHPEPGIIPGDFDPLLYIGLNPQAKERLGGRLLTDVIDHLARQDYQRHGGIYRTFLSEEEARNVPENFNAFAYLVLNTDVMKAYGHQTLEVALQLATQHYIQAGRNERRFYTEEELIRQTPYGYFSDLLPDAFHPAKYLTASARARDDLKNVTLGNVMQEAVRHALHQRIGAQDSEEDYAVPERVRAEDSGEDYAPPEWLSSQNSKEQFEKSYLAREIEWDNTAVPVDFNPFVYLMIHGHLMNEYGNLPIGQLVDAVRHHYRNWGVESPEDYREGVFERRLREMPRVTEEDREQVKVLEKRFSGAIKLARTWRFMERFENLTFSEALEKMKRQGADEDLDLDLRDPFPYVERNPEIIFGNDGLPVDFNPISYFILNKGVERQITEVRALSLGKNPQDLTNLTFQEAIEAAKAHYLAYGRAGKLFYHENDLGLLAKYITQDQQRLKAHELRQKGDFHEPEEEEQHFMHLLREMAHVLNQDHGLQRACADIPFERALQAAMQHLLGNPVDFSPEEYLRLNPDLNRLLRGKSPLEVSKHYRDQGRMQGKVYKRGPDLFGLPEDFDPAVYQNLHPDLIDAFGDDLTAVVQHFRVAAKNEHRRYKPVGLNLMGLPNDFDPELYRTLNPELVPELGEDLQAFADHYFYTGKGAGRAYKFDVEGLPYDFNVEDYIELNPELAERFKDTPQAAIDHYREEGKRDGRIYRYNWEELPEDFDGELYVDLNIGIRDLLDADDYRAAAKHYLAYGKREGRVYKLNLEGLPRDFDVFGYLNLNPELAERFKDNPQAAMDHYRQEGKRDGRIYRYNWEELPEDFDGRQYLALNPQILERLQDNYNAFERDYLAYGKREGRAYKLNLEGVPDDFSVDGYLRLNLDLIHFKGNLQGAVDHYRAEGRAQGRVYEIDYNLLPDDFDEYGYLLLNPEVEEYIKGTRMGPEMHYLAHGMRAHKPYKVLLETLPDDFDYENYLIFNDDLRAEMGYFNRQMNAEKHYVAKGQKEGRVYKVDMGALPHDFNRDIFYNLNPDLKEAFDDFGLSRPEAYYVANKDRLHLRYKEDQVQVNPKPTNEVGEEIDDFGLPVGFQSVVYFALYSEEFGQFYANSPEHYTIKEVLEIGLPEHYITQGAAQKRLHTTEDLLKKMAKEKDGANAFPFEGIVYFHRMVPEDFHPAFYLVRNPWLLDVYKNVPILKFFDVLKEHYLSIGQNEYLKYEPL